MKIFVYGKNSDDKGTQLEVLTTNILRSMGYTVARNEIKMGGNELDVVATKHELIGGDINLICECKAYNNLVSMTDWLKFIGKLHLELRKNQMTHGLMIALSGANGNVLGSYHDIKGDNFITLITNEDILSHIEVFHKLIPEREVAQEVGKYTRKDIVETNIIYYRNLFYWYICFPNGEYTILKDDLTCIEDDLRKSFIGMIKSQTDSRLFIDIKEEYEAIQRRSLIRSHVLSFTLDEIRTVHEIVSWINSVEDSLKVTQDEVETEVKSIPFLTIKEEDVVSLIEEKDIDTIEFYRFIFKDMVSSRVLSTRFYKEHIDSNLLDRIWQVQCNIQIPKDKAEECLFLLKHSPSALVYSIYEDRAITSYRNKNRAILPNLESAHTEWYLDNVMSFFIRDYNNSYLSEYYLDMEKIASIDIHTKLIVYKEGHEPIEFRHYKALCIGHLGAEYNNKAVLMVKIPDKNK